MPQPLIDELHISDSLKKRLKKAGLNEIPEVVKAIDDGSISKRVSRCGEACVQRFRNAIAEWSARQNSEDATENENEAPDFSRNTWPRWVIGVGFVFLIFGMTLSLIAFFFESLAPHQMSLLRLFCAMATGFGSVCFSGYLKLETYLHIPGQVGRLGISAGAGFATFFLVFFYLFPAQEHDSASVRLMGERTDEQINRKFLFWYTLDGETIEHGPEQGWGGVGTVTGVSAGEIAKVRAEAKGYEFVSWSPSTMGITMKRNSDHMKTIVPGAPLTLVDRIPTPEEYKSETNSELPPSQVRLTIDNRTDSHVDVLLLHYLGSAASVSTDRMKWTPIRCPPKEKTLWPLFGLKPGYFMVYGSTHGESATFLTQGSFYKTPTPKLILSTESGKLVGGLINY